METINYLTLFVILFIGSVWGGSIYTYYRDKKAKIAKKKSQMDKYNK